MTACDQAARTGGTGAALHGQEISGKTVGIVGTGAIGLKTAQLFLAFGAKVIAYSRSKRSEADYICFSEGVDGAERYCLPPRSQQRGDPRDDL